MITSLPQARSFDSVAGLVKEFVWRPEVQVGPAPSPQRIAPFSVALTADVSGRNVDLGSGRLVLLHDPEGNEAWQGDYRMVSFVRAEVDAEMVTDPLLADVGWAWLSDALADHQAQYTSPSGTVTAVASKCFGEMDDEPERAEVEIRASWTPVLDDEVDINAHLAAWQDLLCMTCGLPPVPEGVLRFPTPRVPTTGSSSPGTQR